MFERLIIAVPGGYYTVVTFILAGLVGLCVGSFLNVVIYRVPLEMSLSFPASHCPKCGYKLKWYDNIPVLSYCLLGGKCRSCKEHISFRYTTVELANMILWLLCVFLFKDNVLYMGAAMVTSSVCLCVCFIDIENMIIPDRFQIILGIAAIAAVLTDTGYHWMSHLIAGIGGGAIFLAVCLLVGLLMKREALGGGDIKFAAISGLMLGWQKFLLMILISSVSGSIFMIIRNRKNKDHPEIPFAPFLTCGLLIALFAGDQIIHLYMSLLIG